MDNYLLDQINDNFINNWNDKFGTHLSEKEKIIEELKKIIPSTEIIFTTKKEGGNFYFFTSGTTGKPKEFVMDPSSLFEAGLSTMYEKLFHILSHKLRKAIIAFPMAGCPMGLKHSFALINLGVDVYPAGARNYNFTPEQIVDVIHEKEIEILVCRPLEAGLYARIAEKTHKSLESVMAVLLSGEIIREARLKFLMNKYPNAIIRSVYGLTEINSGVFSCENGHYHFINNGQTIVELLPTENPKLYEILFTVLRPELSAIRYKTNDVAEYIKNCDCSLQSPAFKIRGRFSDQIADNYFISDISESLYNDGIEHEIFASKNGDIFNILLKTKKKYDDNYFSYWKNKHSNIQFQNELLETDYYIPRTKSTTVDRFQSYLKKDEILN